MYVNVRPVAVACHEKVGALPVSDGISNPDGLMMSGAIGVPPSMTSPVIVAIRVSRTTKSMPARSSPSASAIRVAASGDGVPGNSTGVIA